MTRQTALTRTEAEEIASRAEKSWGRTIDQQTQKLRATALVAVDTTGKALWWISMPMFFALCAAVGGAILGVRNVREQSQL